MKEENQKKNKLFLGNLFYLRFLEKVYLSLKINNFFFLGNKNRIKEVKVVNNEIIYYLKN